MASYIGRKHVCMGEGIRGMRLGSAGLHQDGLTIVPSSSLVLSLAAGLFSLFRSASNRSGICLTEWIQRNLLHSSQGTGPRDIILPAASFTHDLGIGACFNV